MVVVVVLLVVLCWLLLLSLFLFVALSLLMLTVTVVVGYLVLDLRKKGMFPSHHWQHSHDELTPLRTVSLYDEFLVFQLLSFSHHDTKHFKFMTITFFACAEVRLNTREYMHG